jgi:FkbM family methyltransferase
MRQKLRLALYQWVLRLPSFRGTGRIQEAVRKLLFPHLVADVDHGLRIEIDPWEWVQIEILKNGCTEPETLCLFEHILRPGDTYYDVGAHIGFHALVARRFVGARGRVIAIDPQPYNCTRILRNSAINGFHNIAVIVGAIGDRSGSVLLHEQGIRDKSRLSMALESTNDELQQFEVPMIRLASLIENRGDRNIRLLKVDVEGYEWAVVESASSQLASIDNSILEILPECMESEKTGPMLNHLTEHGYTLLDVRGSPWNREQCLPENNLWATKLRGDEKVPGS